MKKKVKNYLLNQVKQHGGVHLSLIDPVPSKVNLTRLPEFISALDRGGSDGFMVGGSTALDASYVTKVIQSVKRGTGKPVILFPSGVGGVSEAADAIFFMMPLNSMNPYFLGKVQALAAPQIRRKKLEAISLAYLIFQPGGSAGYICDANPLPRNKPEIAIAYAMAAELQGFEFIYLEAGSGATDPIPIETIAGVSKAVKKSVISGGGIKNPEQAAKAIKAGADIIVQGTKFETAEGIQQVEREVRKTVKAIKQE